MARRRVFGSARSPRGGQRITVLGARGYPGEGVIIEGGIGYYPGDWGMPEWGWITTPEAWGPPRVADRFAPWGIPMIPRPEHPIDIPLTTLNRDVLT